jgi:hypothetical protein
MSNQEIGNQFRTEEIVWMAYYDKNTGEWAKTAYPKVGGRLRLAHGDNGKLGITTEIIHYDDKVAVVKAQTATAKGQFVGHGMASVERDQRIAPAILELAETRAIARSLRFADYGVEYCSAEEISHLEQVDGQDNAGSFEAAAENPPQKDDSRRAVYCSAGAGNLPGGGTIVPPPQEKGGNGGGDGNGNSRITHRQLNFLISLGEDIGWTFQDLNKESQSVYGVNVDHLSRRDASDFITALKAKAAS